MKKESFCSYLRSGKSVCAVYSANDNHALVEIWKYKEQFILTWEEAPGGAQHDESRYTRDERHVFSSIDEICVFLESNSLAYDIFKPVRGQGGAKSVTS